MNNLISGARMRREQHERFELEKARLNAFWVIMPNVKRGKSFKPADLGKFAWEKDENEGHGQILTREDFEALMAEAGTIPAPENKT